MLFVRLISRLAAWFGLRRPAIASATVPPLILPSWADWQHKAPLRLARPLAAQLASQARLNIPKGRKAAADTPKAVRALKRAPVPRSVHLQARHLAAKAASPRPSASVIMLPIRTARSLAARPLRAAA